ncbi:unnamed protein product [Rhodiola kirilowii]
MAVRNTLVKYLRMNAKLAPQIGGATAPFGLLYRRCFSDDGRGSFLDKSEVTDINVQIVKNFQKIDPSKVPPQAQFQNYVGLDSLDVVEVVMVLEEEFGFEISDNEADKLIQSSLLLILLRFSPPSCLPSNWSQESFLMLHG